MKTPTKSIGSCKLLQLFVGVLLCISVYGWGTQYKLSLYHGGTSHTARIGDAKLLSPKERPASVIPQVEIDSVPIAENEQYDWFPPLLLSLSLLTELIGLFLVWSIIEGLSLPSRLYAQTSFFASLPPPDAAPQR